MSLKNIWLIVLIQFSLQFIKKSDEHKDATVLSLCWDDGGARLFAGDDRGIISVTNVPTTNMVILYFEFDIDIWAETIFSELPQIISYALQMKGF